MKDFSIKICWKTRNRFREILLLILRNLETFVNFLKTFQIQEILRKAGENLFLRILRTRFSGSKLCKVNRPLKRLQAANCHESNPAKRLDSRREKHFLGNV